MFDETNPTECFATTTASVFLRDGGTAEITCSNIDRRKLHGATIQPFTTNEGQQTVFVIIDPAGNRTDYEKDGEETDGKGVFNYLASLPHNYHLKDNDWRHLQRANWEARKKPTSRTERRLDRAMRGIPQPHFT